MTQKSVEECCSFVDNEKQKLAMMTLSTVGAKKDAAKGVKKAAKGRRAGELA